ncbi:MAG: allantoinase AllB [Sulfobacillus acidophilus]|uniref:Allantoinase n=1 Tax=Sulfobacillus acidophilus TaxID=53633 RepID=A0A2T2WH18_9FIRM|nr:MAG: allantoinase AllB [Sulfobacillus acidophilus]
MSRLYDFIVRNGQIVTSESTFQGDIAIRDGKFAEISENRTIEGKGHQEIDATGQHVFPGLIDIHVHFNEPGRSEWEGIATGSRSLAAGGVTTYVDMPLNSTPPVFTVEDLIIKRRLAEEKSIVNAKFWGGLVPTNIDQLKALHEGGVVGFKAFMSPSGIDEYLWLDDEALYQGMKEIASLGSILAVHAESADICGRLTDEKLSQGKTTARDYVESRPIASEVQAVTKLISYAQSTGCKVHVVHASNRKVAQLVSDAKAQGVDISVETCPHYLSLSVHDLEEQGGVAKCSPPLRDAEELDELWVAVAHGEIDIIASDHSPAPESLKRITGNFFEGWGGISGAQSTLNVLLTEGFHRKRVSLQSIVRLMATNPARRFRLKGKGHISVGYDADLALVDLNETFTLRAQDLFYRHKHSPYVGKNFRGKVKTTIVGGQVIFDADKIMVDRTTA